MAWSRSGGSRSSSAAERSVFLSYRRDDSAGWAGRLADRLNAELGAGTVFLDVDSIPVGSDFGESIAARLETVTVTLALIGPQWADARTDDDRRRLDDPDDFVRREIATSLSAGLLVIPVLVDGAEVPPADELPDELKPLSQRNAIRMHADSFEPALERLIDALGLDDDRSAPSRRLVATIGAGVAVVALLFGLLVMNLGGDDPDDADEPTSSTTVPAATTTAATASTTTSTSVAETPTGTIDLTFDPQTSEGHPVDFLPEDLVVIVQEAGADLPSSSAFDEDESVLAVIRPSGVPTRTLIRDVEAGGQVQVVNMAPGWSTAITYVDLVPGGVATATLDLTGSDTLVSGLVTDQQGAALAGVTVDVEGPSGTRTTRTSALGEFEIDRVESPALLTISARLDDYSSATATLETTGGEPADVNLTLVYGRGSVVGSVVDSDGQGLGGVTVEATLTGTDTTLTVTTLTEEWARGQFFLPELEPGQYTLVVDAEGFDRAVRLVVVDPAQQLQIDLQLASTE